MKYIILLSIICLFLISNKETTGQIHFVKSYKKALKYAKKFDKKIFIDVYTQWCGPCKRMEQTTFKEKEVGYYFSQNYISVKIDAEKGEGPVIKNKFGVSSYPTLIFLDKNGNLINKVTGALNAKRLIKEAKASMSEDIKLLKEKTRKYIAGEIKTKDLPEYIEMLYKVKLDYSEPLKTYLLSLKPKEIKTKKLYNLLARYSNSPFDFSFQYLLKYYKKYSKLVDKFNLDYYMYWKYAFQTYENNRQSKSNDRLYKDLKKAGIKFGPAVKENFDIVVNVLKDRTKDDEIIERTDKLIKKYPFTLSGIFNEISKQTIYSTKLLNYCNKIINQYKESQPKQIARMASAIASNFCINKQNYQMGAKYFGIAAELDPENKNYKRYHKSCQESIGEIRPKTFGNKAYDFTLPNLKGEEISLHQFKGKYVLLDFWASWCGPCKGEIPYLKKMHNKYSKNLIIISISSDKNSEDWKNAVKAEGMNWIQLNSNGTDINKRYNTKGIPRIILLDKQGKIFGDNLRGNIIEKDFLKLVRLNKK